MYLAPACCVWLGLGCLLVEVPTIMRNNSLDIMFEHKALFLAAAVMGFAVNTLAYTTIKLASSLTLKVGAYGAQLRRTRVWAQAGVRACTTATCTCIHTRASRPLVDFGHKEA